MREQHPMAKKKNQALAVMANRTQAGGAAVYQLLTFLTNPSSLHSSEPTPLWTKNNPVGSYFFFTAARRA